MPGHADAKKADANRVLGALISQRPPTLEEFLELFFTAAGGAKAVAAMLFTEFHAARPGSLLRTRVLEMVVRAMKHTEGKDKTVEMGLLSDDDLDREVEQRLESLNARTPDAKRLGPAATS